MRIPASKPHPKLDLLLKESAGRKLTPREIWLQCVSFVYGQMMNCAPHVTREEVERHAIEHYGPCPD